MAGIFSFLRRRRRPGPAEVLAQLQAAENEHVQKALEWEKQLQALRQTRHDEERFVVDLERQRDERFAQAKAAYEQGRRAEASSRLREAQALETQAARRRRELRAADEDLQTAEETRDAELGSVRERIQRLKQQAQALEIDRRRVEAIERLASDALATAGLSERLEGVSSAMGSAQEEAEERLAAARGKMAVRRTLAEAQTEVEDTLQGDLALDDFARLHGWSQAGQETEETAPERLSEPVDEAPGRVDVRRGG